MGTVYILAEERLKRPEIKSVWDIQKKKAFEKRLAKNRKDVNKRVINSLKKAKKDEV